MFIQARLKLTALYVITVAVIVCGFSVYLYQNIQSNLQDSDQDNFSDMQHHDSFIDHTLSETRKNILFADAVIIIGAAGLSYMLAGMTLRPIQQSLEAQRSFAANASHELRTPLAVMKNDIEVLQHNLHRTKGDENATLRSNLEEIARMSSIVEDLLLLARSDNQKITEFTTVDLSLLVRSVSEKMRVLAERKGVAFSNVSSGTGTVRSSPTHLERAILNIIQNSIDHTPAGGSITVTTAQDPKFVHLSVSDTGVGISQQDLPHVFTRFYKGETSTGTGLGLAIVKGIIEQHGGAIIIESAAGTGTVVRIDLPLV